jgi:hypothetical protein
MHPESPVKFIPNLTVGSKVIAFTNLYSSLARPDLLLNEYRFHVHYMEKGLQKLK